MYIIVACNKKLFANFSFIRMLFARGFLYKCSRMDENNKKEEKEKCFIYLKRLLVSIPSHLFNKYSFFLSLMYAFLRLVVNDVEYEKAPYLILIFVCKREKKKKLR